MLRLHTCQDFVARHQARADPGFYSMKRLGVFLLPLHGILVDHRVTPGLSLLVPIYTPGWREAL